MDRDGAAARFGGFLMICGVILAWAYILIVPPPRLSASFANGSYFNPCCGVVRLSDGNGSTEHGSFKYIIEKDKGGPYVLPTDHAAIAVPGSISLLTRNYTLFIRIDNAPRPNWIDVIGPEAEHRFVRR
jgi:hypothetical protein